MPQSSGCGRVQRHVFNKAYSSLALVSSKVKDVYSYLSERDQAEVCCRRAVAQPLRVMILSGSTTMVTESVSLSSSA